MVGEITIGRTRARGPVQQEIARPIVAALLSGTARAGATNTSGSSRMATKVATRVHGLVRHPIHATESTGRQS
jgi:hypothetical protein